MWTIRPEQVLELAAAGDRALADRLAADLCQHWTARCEELGEGLRDAVLAGIARGRAYGLASERDLLRFLNVAFALGDDFDERYAEARAILENRALDAGHRVAQLTKWARTKLP